MILDVLCSQVTDYAQVEGVLAFVQGPCPGRLEDFVT